MKNTIFKIGGLDVKPGTHQLVELPVARLYTHTRMNLPVHVIHGRSAGPKLLVCAAIHGDELNGVEIINRLLRLKSINRLKGTLIAVPFVNSFGMLQNSRYLPDRRDLNRCFPGSDKGSMASRLANVFLEQVVGLCDYGIDFHTGAIHRSNLPQIRANLDDRETEELATAFGVPVVINSKPRTGTLRNAATDLGVKTLLFEGGEALRIDEFSVRAGVRGVLNVMKYLDMLPRRKQPSNDSAPFEARSSSWMRAPHSGLFQSCKKLGDQVHKDELLGVITDPSDMFDATEYEIRSRFSGIVIGKTNIPLLNEGDAVFHIARFEDADDVEEEVDNFEQATFARNAVV